MKKYLVIILALVLSCCTPPKTIQTATSYKVTNVIPLKGVNNAWFFNQFKTGYPPDSVVTKINKLGLRVVRFPGGSSSFLFDINKTAYGYPGDTKPNYAAAQVQLCQQTNTQTIYVANLYQPLTYPSPENEAYWIQNIVETMKVLKAPYVELGNEFPIYNHLSGVTSGQPRLWESKIKFIEAVTVNATRYVRLCEKVMAAIRAAGFNPQFGVVMDQPLHLRGKTWNGVVRAWGQYNAEIFHYYSTAKDAATILSDFNRIFVGHTKPIWLTEWGFQHGMESKDNLDAIGKPYYIAYPTNMRTAMIQYGDIEIDCQHQLYTSSPYGIIKP